MLSSPDVNGVYNIRGKEYKTVALRVQEFREKYPIHEGWCILTERIPTENPKLVQFVAKIINPERNIVATGHAIENDQGIVNAVAQLENCETSAIGRALAAAGFAGREFASANEMERVEAKRNRPQEKQKKQETPNGIAKKNIVNAINSEYENWVKKSFPYSVDLYNSKGSAIGSKTENLTWMGMLEGDYFCKTKDGKLVSTKEYVLLLSEKWEEIADSEAHKKEKLAMAYVAIKKQKKTEEQKLKEAS